MLGIVVVNKPQGITSHDVVNRVRRALGTRRVGHAGTLDPMATGALVVAVGPATRFLQYLSLEPKTYRFTVKFGQETNTQDAEGEVVGGGPVPDDLAPKIEDLLPSFRGGIEQLPPMYSAIKKDGKPLYLYARQGEEVERARRTITLFDYQLIEVDGDTASLECTCSGGTYVRTLAHDLGQKLGCGAHLVALERTHVGRFTLNEAIPLDEVSLERIMPLREALEPLPMVTLPPDVEARIREGQRVPLRPVPDGKFVGMLDGRGEVIGVASLRLGSLQPECVIPREPLSPAN